MTQVPPAPPTPAAAPPAPVAAAPPPLTRQQRVMLVLIPTFLVLYVLPVLVAAVVVPFGGLEGDEPVGKWFFFVLTEPEDPMGLVQRLLLPLTAGITVAGLWSDQGWRMTLALIGLTLLAMMAIALIWWFLLVPDNADNLYQPVRQTKTEPIDTPAEFATVARTYLLGRFEALAGYLAVVLGLVARR